MSRDRVRRPRDRASVQFQRQQRSGGAGKQTLVQKRYTQRSQGPVASGAADVHAHAASGVQGSGAELPHRDAIQKSFGGHDVGNVKAHVGGAAAAASESMGAEAYATGDDVAFRTSPDLHTAAHEAAHVVQQRGGVQLKGGVGETGDSYEQHANAVADAVVAGRSAENLLDGVAGAGAGATDGAASHVQHKAVQFWSGHEHRAMGNMGAIIATGDANFNVNDFLDQYRSTDADPNKGNQAYRGAPSRGTAGQVLHGVEQSTDPVLMDLEQQAAGRVDVRTNDTVMRDEHGRELARRQNNISFGAASEFGGDYSKTPGQLATADSSDNPGGNDFVTMAGIAATNINHFYPLNIAEYQRHHGLALAAAQAGNRRQALLEEGFASHFLEDSFAAGHMAPRALDRTTLSGMDEDELGLNRTKDWHDALNAVEDPAGLPTTRGGFHGDDTMTGNDLTRIAVDVGASLKEVLTTLAGRPVAASITLPAPAFSQIMAHEKYGPLWGRMMDDYEEDLRDAEVDSGTLTTDGGTSMDTSTAASKIRANVFGANWRRLLRLGNNEWNGDILVFNLTQEGRPAPAETEVWVQWFDRDMGYDRDVSGRDTGTLANERTLGWASLRDTDEKIGAPRKITLTAAGIGSAKAADDDTNDTYAVFFSDSECTVPIGRSKVQGQRTGRVEKPLDVSGFSWSGSTLSFRVAQDSGPVNGRRVYLNWYNNDSGMDRDSSGNQAQTIADTDSQTGPTHTVVVRGGRASLAAQGDANNPNDTYATIYLDAACQIPLGRSPVQPGSWYQ